MTERNKLALLEETLELDEGTLEADMVLSEIAEYDSMAKLAIIVLMSDEFGKELKGEQIKQFVTVQDILDYME